MKGKKWISAVAITCSIMLAGSGIGATVFAQNSDGSALAVSAASKETVQTGEKNSKEETVYALAGADGSVSRVLVSDWLKNPEGLQSLEDFSELSSITNLKGDETFSENDGKLVWAAEGNDIYYRGDIEKKLPVTFSVKYTLNGEPVSSDELAGKSGRVTMTFEYQNNETKTVTIDGKKMSVKVPFVVLTGLMLDGEKFSNISVSNGKVVNDGSRSIVMGFALPGLQESLEIPAGELEIPESVTVSADVTGFELDTSLTLVTNDLFNELDLDDASLLDDADGKISALTDGLTRLTDGSSSLYSGLDTLLTKSNELISGIKALYTGAQRLVAGAQKLSTGAAKLNTGAQQLNGGAAALSAGASDLAAGAQKLSAGVDALSAGLAELVANNANLTAGADQVFTAMLNTASTQLRASGIDVTLTKSGYETQLDGIVATQIKNVETQLKSIGLLPSSAVLTAKNYKTVLAGVQDQIGAIPDFTPQTYDTARQAVILTAALGRLKAAGQCPSVNYMTAEEYYAAVKAGHVESSVSAAVTNAVQQIAAAYASGDPATTSAINGGIQQVLKSSVREAIDGLSQLISSVTGLKTQLNSYRDDFQQGLKNYTDAASAIAGKVTTELQPGASNLNSGMQTLQANVPELLSGVSALCAGAKELNGGSAELSNGMQQLFAGISELKTKSSELPNGVSLLKNGAMQLSDGMKTLSGEDGIGKLIDLYSNGIRGLTDHLHALKEASAQYTSFAGSAEKNPCSVKFIYRTDSISIPEGNGELSSSSGSK